MSISLIVAFAGVLLALAGILAMAMRCARLPRTDLIAWTCAMFGLAVALVAQAAGFAAGFSSTTFRAVQLGAQVIGMQISGRPSRRKNAWTSSSGRSQSRWTS